MRFVSKTNPPGRASSEGRAKGGGQQIETGPDKRWHDEGRFAMV